MSWFDTAGIASFAKSALNTAQKTIDKALDIQEEKEIRRDKVTKIPETDNFFEAFGLSDQPSTSSQPEIKPSLSHNVLSELQLQQASIYGSGFWTDTWGSFFEMKNANLTKPDSMKESLSIDSSPPENSRKDNAVLSQPHRASPFPSDSTQTLTQESPKSDVPETSVVVEDIKSSEKKEASKECLPEHTTASTNVRENQDNIVTLQPSNDSVLSSKHETNLLTISSSIVDENSNKQEIPETQAAGSECDITETISETENPKKDLENVPTMLIVPDDGDNKPVDESQYISVHEPAESSNISKKVESEYDVIEMSDSDVSNNATENSSDSFTRSASVEVVTSMSQCSPYDISSSTIEIPDLPENMTENLGSWEWSAMENVSPDLYVTQCENTDFDGSDNSQSIQMISSDSSFHTITASSFTDNRVWVKSDKSSHFTDESPTSSNEERNSHHSDGSSNSSKDDDDTDTAEAKEYDAKSSSSNGSRTTSSSSFVKCSADDNDNGSHRGPSPISTTASERSDVTKHESEQNTSGDENETATSSDIEILSPPNGENGDRNTSPLKHIWLPRLRRSESPTSDSSKDSLMPVVSELEEINSSSDNKSSSHYTKDDSLHHKIFSEDYSLAKLLQKQEELQTVLDAREKKILELNKETIELQENEQRLKNLIQKMRVEQAKESRDIAALTKEFTQRLSLVENQLRETMQERDALQIELQEAKKEISKRICAADMEEVIKEKDIQIKELTDEGQKLSKKELQFSTIIKKLRAKQEETDKTIKSQAEKLEDNSKEVERLRKSIGAKEEQEKKHIDAIRQLTNNVKKLEKEVASLKSSLEDSTEKELSLKKSLDSTYKDLTDLRKSYAAKETELEDLKLGLELVANENLQQMLENAHRDAAKEKEMLLLQIQELRCTLSRSEEEANLREKMYKADIASLQKRLQEAEERNEDLTKNVSSATRPLVRQIENLQATYNAQTISWEKIEKNLTDRLSDAQNQLALMYEKERSATEKYMEYHSKVTAYETQNNSLRQEKLQLTSEVESLKAKIIVLEENKSRESYTIEKLKDNFNTEIGKLKKEKAELEKTMATCLEQLDSEKKKVLKLEEEIKFRETRALIMSNVSRSSSPTGSVRSSVSSIHNWSQDEIQESGSHTPVNSYRMSVYESLRLGNGSSLLENLQSQLKQREGEIIQLQSEIAKLEQVKESMTRELVLLSEQNEEFETKVNKLESVEKEFKELDQKYNTLLQMYGEKVEETEELQLDLADVKTMYKAQIEELLRNK